MSHKPPSAVSAIVRYNLRSKGLVADADNTTTTVAYQDVRIWAWALS
jgi:hypothetical protein